MTGRAPEFYDDHVEVLKELETQSDRAVGIVGPALVDARLRYALELIFVKNLPKASLKDIFEGPRSPLGSYWGRIQVAHALGVIGDLTKRDLEVIGTIRNKFAHKLKYKGFDHEDIAPLCAKLALADYVIGGAIPPSDARTRFIAAIINALHFLYAELVAGTPVGEVPSKSP